MSEAMNLDERITYRSRLVFQAARRLSVAANNCNTEASIRFYKDTKHHLRMLESLLIQKVKENDSGCEEGPSGIGSIPAKTG